MSRLLTKKALNKKAAFHNGNAAFLYFIFSSQYVEKVVTDLAVGKDL
jgi:hypothetical protein